MVFVPSIGVNTAQPGGVAGVPARDGLAFTGNVEVTDDPAGNRTVVNVPVHPADPTNQTVPVDAGVALGDAITFVGGVGVKATALDGNPDAEGIVISKPTGTSAIVLESGASPPALYAGLTAGAVYYLSATTPGGITSSPPTASGQKQQKLGRAVTSTQLWVDVEDGVPNA